MHASIHTCTIVPSNSVLFRKKGYCAHPVNGCMGAIAHAVCQTHTCHPLILEHCPYIHMSMEHILHIQTYTCTCIYIHTHATVFSGVWTNPQHRRPTHEYGFGLIDLSSGEYRNQYMHECIHTRTLAHWHAHGSVGV